MEKEIQELKEFVAEIKADRIAQKEKEKKEAWTKYVSLTIVITAVLAAIASQWGGKYSGRTLTNLNDATYNQALASDQWNYFQANSIKEKLYDIAREQLNKGGAADARALEKIEGKLKKYVDEKDKAEAQARALEKKRDVARDAATLSSRQGGAIGLAVSLFSISVAVGSICLVVKKKPLWYVSMLLGGAATVQTVYAVWFVH